PDARHRACRPRGTTACRGGPGRNRSAPRPPLRSAPRTPRPSRTIAAREHSVVEALIITLREGMEAALVLAIALAMLRRRGATHLRGALFAGAAVALVLSVVGAALAVRVTYNEELAEGVAMLVGSLLVVSLVWWMWRAAPHMKEEVESGVMRAAGGGGSATGLFLFAFGMVFREGIETAIFLSAAGLNSRGLALWLGALLGIAIAVGFG